MSQENVEIVRRMNAAFNRRDRDEILAYYHPNAEICAICSMRRMRRNV